MGGFSLNCFIYNRTPLKVETMKYLQTRRGSLARGGVVGLAVTIFILVVIVGFMLQMTAEIEGDIDINETESPEAYAAVADVFEKSYRAQQQFGNVITLSVIGIIIAVVSGFVAYTRQA